VRQQAQVDQAWQAANLIASAGGFGVIVIDLGGLSTRKLGVWQRRPWIRLKQALEHTSTALVVLVDRHLAGAAAGVVLELRREQTEWDGLLGEVIVRADAVRDKYQATRDKALEVA
jgi:hypothetical protein